MRENTLFDDTVLHLHTKAGSRLTTFLASLREACRLSPPPYGEGWYAEAYDSVASNADWLASSFLTYSQEEAAGTIRLIVLAKAGEHIFPQAVPIILKHACDESQHVLYFLELLDNIFPKASYGESRSLLEQGHSYPLTTAPTKQLSSSQIVREVIKINIGEVKNRVHLSLMRRWALAHCPPSRLEAVDRITNTLIRDEVNHIIYSGWIMQLIGEASSNASILSSYVREFDQFNDQLISELRYNNLVPPASS